MAVFRKRMRGMQRKYKILWFVVDLYHRQRYFFICGCKRIVTKPGVANRRQSFERRENASVSLSPFPVLFQDIKS